MTSTKPLTPAARLAQYKKFAAEVAAGNGAIGGDTDNWRTYASAENWRSHSPAKMRANWGPKFAAYGSDNNRWCECDPSDMGLRFVGYADEILPRAIHHTGWYTDNYQSETVRGAVWQLPSREGQLLFVHGFRDPFNSDSAQICFDLALENTANLDACDFESAQNTAAARQAASWAHRMAELYAEESREYCAKDTAEQDISTAKEQIGELRKEASAIITDLRAGDELRPAICDVVRSRLAGIRADLHRELKTIEQRRADYWSAVN